ncbi:MAG: DUF4917 family protein [Alphaproteobacteria bacterium]
MTEQTQIIDYSTMLLELKNSETDCHLLLGNGFNASLGVKTTYENIFNEMKNIYSDYSMLEDDAKKNYYDIEILIKKIEEASNVQDKKINTFLSQFIETKIKLDFMKATYSIVKNEIKTIYQEKKDEGIYLLFKNFNSYFTLNYDPFLYLILMKYKENKLENQAISFLNSYSFIQDELNKYQNYIYSDIQELRKSGTNWISVGNDNPSKRDMSKMTKSAFEASITEHFKDKKWKTKDIKRVCDYIWEKEKGNNRINNINDGFLSEEFNPILHSLQNIFFLHGAFHIYEKNRSQIYKITQEKNKALYQKLEDTINSEEKEIVCVFSGTSKEKIDSIQENSYLRHCYGKLSTLNGSLVIFGSSMAENDNHIFEQINKSMIDNIYISNDGENITSDYKKMKELFPNKKITLFNYNTVSYSEKKQPINIG